MSIWTDVLVPVGVAIVFASISTAFVFFAVLIDRKMKKA
jgi:hypothetical protein